MNKRTTLILAVIFLAAVGVFTFVGWPGDSGEEDAGKTKTVAIATLMSHPALDSVQSNLIRELERQGYQKGENVRYITRNANGQAQRTQSIATDLISQNPDVVVPITTPMSQAVVNAARDVPVVFAAVTDPVGAGLVPSLKEPKPGVTGTSDAWPYEDQLRLIRRITPNVENLGVLYNPGEAASQYGIRQIRKHAPQYGFKLTEGSVSSSNQVAPVARNVASQADALFLSSDNTVISGAAGALKVAAENNIPLYVGDSGTVKKGGLAAVSVGYSELGRETGRLVARVLEGERKIPVVVGRGTEIHVNTRAAELMGVTIPDSVLSEATNVYDTIEQ